MSDDTVMHKQMLLKGDLQRVESYGAEHPSTYAGLKFDGACLIALFTNPDVHRAALLARVEHPEDVDVHAAPHSRRHLARIHGEVRQVVAAEPGSCEQCGPGLMAVHVGLAGGFEHIATQLHDRFGDSVDITVGGHHFPLDLNATVPPMRAPASTIALPHARLDIPGF